MEDDLNDSTSDEEENLLIHLLIRRRLKRRKRRTIWIANFRKFRKQLGEFHTLLAQLNEAEFKKYLRVTRSDFDIIHQYVEHDLKKMNTNYREAISSEKRLAVCLR